MDLANRILHVDLSNNINWIEEISREKYIKYAGSRGLAAEILFRDMKKGINPLSPENLFIVGSGTFNGTMAPCSGRLNVVSKSPLTGGIFKSNVGSAWGANFHQAGYTLLVVHGASEKPSMIRIEDDKVTIESAEHLWGKNIWETNFAIEEQEGFDYEIMAIGPAGENLVMSAAVMFSFYNAAARGGLAAVMGAKNLKAIIVKGEKGIVPIKAQEFFKLSEALRHKILAPASSKRYWNLGTANSVSAVNAIGAFPVYNFQTGGHPDVDKISGHELVRTGALKARRSCYSCVFACHRFSMTEDGKATGGPEYETISALGGGCGIFDLQELLYLDHLCSLYGLDTISSGAQIQWAMESVQRGTLDPEWTEEIMPRFGDAESAAKLLKAIAYREGKLGNLLADGIKKASQVIGNDSSNWAVQAKGLEQSRVEVRCAYGYALAFAVNHRGPDHLCSQPIAEMGSRENQVVLIEKITGDRKYASPYQLEKRAEIVTWHENVYAITDSLGFCTFTSLSEYENNPETMAQILSAYLGIDVSMEELYTAGERTISLERAFNVREGFRRKDDTLPRRMMYEKLEGTPNPDAIITPEKLNYMLDQYYTLREWNLKTGIPSKEKLIKLELDFVADEFDVLGIYNEIGGTESEG